VKILIIGAGNVGATLGRVWLERGHDVRFGVPNPSDPKYATLPKERLQPANELRDAEIAVLATPFPATQAAIEALGGLSGVTVLDCTNPLGMGPDGLHLALGYDTSGAERVAAWAKGASVFKTLNQTGAENMGSARAYSTKPVMFVAGDDAARKPAVMSLVSDLGFESVDAGPLAAARLLEPLAMLWIELVMKRGQSREFAFAMVSR